MNPDRPPRTSVYFHFWQLLKDCATFFFLRKPNWFLFHGNKDRLAGKKYSRAGLLTCIFAVIAHLTSTALVSARPLDHIELLLLLMVGSMLISLPLLLYFFLQWDAYLFFCNLFSSFLMFLSFNWVFLNLLGGSESPFAFNAVCLTWYSLAAGTLFFNFYVMGRK